MEAISKGQALGIASAACFVTFSAGLSTSPDSLHLRFAAIGLLLAIQYGFLTQYPTQSQYIDAPYGIMTMVFTCFFHAVDYLVVLKVSSKELITSHGSHAGLFTQYIRIPLGLLFKWRRLGTPWQIDKVPPFDRQNPSAVPSRFALILRRLFYIALGAAIIEVMSISSVSTDGLFEKRALFSRLDQVTTDELVCRGVLLVKFLMSAILGVYVGYAFITVLALALGLSSPAECPPMFGSVSKAHSVRGFWGDFYHQSLRRAICGPSDAFVDHVLCLKRGTLVSRYLRLTLAFAISGVIHGYAEFACGVPAFERGQFLFFTCQAFAIIFEDAVKGLYKKLGISMHPYLEKAIGYCWLACWLFWIEPYWAYSSTKYAEPKPSTLRPLLDGLVFSSTSKHEL